MSCGAGTRLLEAVRARAAELAAAWNVPGPSVPAALALGEPARSSRRPWARLDAGREGRCDCGADLLVPPRQLCLVLGFVPSLGYGCRTLQGS